MQKRNRKRNRYLINTSVVDIEKKEEDMKEKEIKLTLPKALEGKAFKEVLKEVMDENPEIKGEIATNLLMRARYDDRSFKVLRDTIGEKPADKMDINSEGFNVNISVVDKREG